MHKNHYISLAILVFLQSPGLASAVVVSSSKLAALPDQQKVILSVISTDCKHIAVVVTEGDNEVLSIDGKKITQERSFQRVILSPNGEHFAFTATSGGKTGVVVDGKEQGEFDEVEDVVFSPGGTHVAISASKGGNAFAVVDGNLGPSFATVRPVIFSADENHWAYAGDKNPGANTALIVDGKEKPMTDTISRLAFTPDADNVSYAGLHAVIIGDRTVMTLQMSSDISFSKDGRHFAYAGIREKSGPRVSGTTGLEAILFVDGEAQVIPTIAEVAPVEIPFVAMSPNGKRIAFIRWDAVGAKQATVINGKPATKIQSFPLVVLDGADGPRLQDVGDIVFSPDSSRVAYTERQNEVWCVNVDGKESPPYEKIGQRAVFSPDSRHVACAVQKNGKWTVLIDHAELPDFTLAQLDPPGKPEAMKRDPTVSFGVDGTLNFIGLKDGELWKVSCAGL